MNDQQPPNIVELELAAQDRQSLIRQAIGNELTANPTTFASHLDIFVEEAKRFMVLRLGEQWANSVKAIYGTELEVSYRIELNLAAALERLEHCDDEISAKFRV